MHACDDYLAAGAGVSVPVAALGAKVLIRHTRPTDAQAHRAATHDTAAEELTVPDFFPSWK